MQLTLDWQPSLIWFSSGQALSRFLSLSFSTLLPTEILICRVVVVVVALCRCEHIRGKLLRQSAMDRAMFKFVSIPFSPQMRHVSIAWSHAAAKASRSRESGKRKVESGARLPVVNISKVIGIDWAWAWVRWVGVAECLTVDQINQVHWRALETFCWFSIRLFGKGETMNAHKNNNWKWKQNFHGGCPMNWQKKTKNTNKKKKKTENKKKQQQKGQGVAAWTGAK